MTQDLIHAQVILGYAWDETEVVLGYTFRLGEPEIIKVWLAEDPEIEVALSDEDLLAAYAYLDEIIAKGGGNDDQK